MGRLRDKIHTTSNEWGSENSSKMDGKKLHNALQTEWRKNEEG